MSPLIAQLSQLGWTILPRHGDDVVLGGLTFAALPNFHQNCVLRPPDPEVAKYDWERAERQQSWLESQFLLDVASE